jgi:uncharacterized protein
MEEKKEEPKRQLNALTRDGYDNFLSRIGLNNDNSLSAGSYTFNLVTRNRILLEAAYRGSWVVGAVIDSVAEDMTRAGVDVVTSEENDLSILEKAMTRLQIWQSLCTTIKWGRLYGGALGVLQIEGQDPATPLDLDTVGKDQFKGIAVYDRWMLNPVLSPVIQEGPDLGLPEIYQIVSSALQSYGTPSYKPGELISKATGIVNVHHTRVMRYTGIDLPFYQAITEMMWGESVLERLWDRLISYDNATLSAAQLIDRANLRTVGIQGLREIIAAGGAAQTGLEKMFEFMRLLQVNEGLTLIDKEDTFASTAYSFAGLSDMLLQFAQQLAGATGIPLVRLFSQPPAGLTATGESDIRMYYDNINAWQEAKLRRPVDVLLKVMWRSVYGQPVPEDLEFNFTPLWQMSASDKAANAKTNTETTVTAYEAGLVPAHTAMQELKDQSGDTGLFSNIQDADISEAESDPPPMPGELDATSEGESEKPDQTLEPVSDAKPTWWRKLATLGRDR